MNANHYGKGTPGGKGGQFAPGPQNGGAENPEKEKARGDAFNRLLVLARYAKSGSSIDCVPVFNRDGSQRIFYSDLSDAEKESFERDNFGKYSEIFRIQDELYDNFNTSKIDTEERRMFRSSAIQDEIDEQMSKGPKKKGREAAIVLGLPGSGKSTVAGPLMESMGAFILDADNFKSRIPEFQKDERMVSAVHGESVMMMDEMMSDVTDEGYNVVIGKVGGENSGVPDIIENLAGKGYTVKLILVDVPVDTTIKRMLGRYNRGETKRLIVPWVFFNADKHIFNTFDEAIKHPAVTEGMIYSNDVEYGQEPILLKRTNKVK